jgi:hypothetical protein
MSKFPAIPEFTHDNPISMAAAMRVMKQTLETLTGQRQDDSFGAPFVYVQETEPKPGKNLFKKGDFWIRPFMKKLYYFDQIWKPVD